MKIKKLLMMAAGGDLTYSDQVLSLSPLAYWPLNETSGTTAIDLVGAHNGAYTGVDLAQSQPPFIAPSFNGISSNVNIYSAWLATNFGYAEGSVSAWIKVAAAGVWEDGTARRAVSLRVDASNQAYIIKSTTNNTVQFAYTAGGTAKTREVTISSTAWIHAALTWSVFGNAAIAYINGAQQGVTLTSLGTWSGALGSATTRIGVLESGNFWSGWIAHVALWNCTLTAAEVANLYAWGVA